MFQLKIVKSLNRSCRYFPKEKKQFLSKNFKWEFIFGSIFVKIFQNLKRQSWLIFELVFFSVTWFSANNYDTLEITCRQLRTPRVIRSICLKSSQCITKNFLLKTDLQLQFDFIELLRKMLNLCVFLLADLLIKKSYSFVFDIQE